MKIRLLIITALISPVLANIIITEIYPNPIEDERLNEWIEIYNNSTKKTNLENITIHNNHHNFTLRGPYYSNQLITIQPYQHAIITSYTTRVYNNFNISKEALKLYAYPSLKGGLRNTYGTIRIQDSTFQYNKTKEDFSLSRINSTILFTEPTPGQSNQKIEGCDWKIEIISNETFNKNIEFTIKITKIYGEKTNITLSRKITKYNTTIKEYNPLKVTASTRKTIKNSPILNRDGILQIHANISADCDINKFNNQESKTIFIEDQKQNKDSEIRILNILDLPKNKTSFGKTIRARIYAYKGDTTKKTLTLQIKDQNKSLSKQTKLNIEQKYTEIETTLPIQITPNCNQKLKNNTYILILKGLDQTQQKEITIEGIDKELCKTIKPENDTISVNRNYQNNKIAYTSKNQKIKNSILYIFSITLIIAIATLAIKPIGGAG